MVNATVDNTPVSEQITAGNSISVPTGETWKVTIVGKAEAVSNASDGGSYSETACEINGVRVASSESSASSDSGHDNASASAATTFPFETVLKGGDTISAVGGGLHIGGFVVNSS